MPVKRQEELKAARITDMINNFLLNHIVKPFGQHLMKGRETKRLRGSGPAASVQQSPESIKLQIKDIREKMENLKTEVSQILQEPKVREILQEYKALIDKGENNRTTKENNRVILISNALADLRAKQKEIDRLKDELDKRQKLYDSLTQRTTRAADPAASNVTPQQSTVNYGTLEALGKKKSNTRR